MSKVWLVTAEDVGGDGVYIVRICATKEIAQQYIERFPDLYDNYLEPAEWDVDAECPERRTRHAVGLSADGTLFCENTFPCDHEEHYAYPVGGGAVGAQSTRGREAALKLGWKKLAEMQEGM